ncbi:MAG: DNA polymerase/3'-5' exonuclease PolX [Sphingobacteriia bacterium]|nr:MAG: DNA polymerase/3'-5' exonuclease PolX [Sphingobacteriia bacterium]TAH07422.1 MAG: DNA polymerase/3'-5' exonuclease PolX [Sphingobacteriia bacterium]
MIHNDEIAHNFSLLAKLMDIHGENSFRSKSYATAAFSIDKLTTSLAEIPAEKIFSIKGIGESAGKKIIEQLETGKLLALETLLQNTPNGILEMLRIKGIGPKKISTIWKELEIETIGELLYACNENRLTLYKGFGEKTQENIKQSIEFYMGTLGRYLYQQVADFAVQLQTLLTQSISHPFLLSGEMRRQMEIIDSINWVTTASAEELKIFFSAHEFTLKEETPTLLIFKSAQNITIGFHITTSQLLQSKLFETSCSNDFLTEWTAATNWDNQYPYSSEDEIFSRHNICPIPPALREAASIIELAKNNELTSLIETEDIKGIIHAHSNWSDGTNTLEEMAISALENGYEYLLITDHSKSAFYAKGLYEDRIEAQHKQIDEINKKINPFRIFKGIESDILNDGSLDYAPEILKTFDLVIASIHSNLKMTEEKAMGRLIKAIENPYTSILGHMTGRLLLSRAGYPVDHQKIIDACAANNVAIELNAHPRRLDMDWRWIHKAMEKNVLISINPDAHQCAGYGDCKYGVLVAQKAGLPKNKNLSSFGLLAFEAFVKEQQAKRP